MSLQVNHRLQLRFPSRPEFAEIKNVIGRKLGPSGQDLRPGRLTWSAWAPDTCEWATIAFSADHGSYEGICLEVDALVAELDLDARLVPA